MTTVIMTSATMTSGTMTKTSSTSPMFLLVIVMLLLSQAMIGFASAEPISTVLPSEEPTSEGVLEDAVLEHMVIYSGLPPAPDYQSWGGFDPRGMEHVYLIVHTFLDLILRDNVLPRGLNTSQVISAARGGQDPSLKLAADHFLIITTIIIVIIKI